MRQRDIDALLSALDDYRAVIAAGKVQRWDVVKWAVALNLGLTTAAVALNGSQPLFFVLSVGVAFVAVCLVFHYNRRMTGARQSATKLFDKVAEDCLDVREVEKDPRQYTQKLFFYDRQELVFFVVIIAASLVPILALYLGTTPWSLGSQSP
jgi:hypothetical protein